MRYLTRKVAFLKYLKCRLYATWNGEVTVYRSTSHNPYENLAFEDWVYLNVDLTNRRILFLWRNEPTIVIGRHQNPWAECNVKQLLQHNVFLARRKSGGGTVYHDLGNVNITFFTPRKLYNRKENLDLLVRVLRDRWKLDVDVSPRDDILLDGKFKVSGSSSKLGKLVSFHHCTLLCHVDELLLKFLLQPSFAEISSKATVSVKSDIANLCTREPSINYEVMTEAIYQRFCQIYSTAQQFKMIDIHPGKEEDFPGITDLKNELQDWQWVYGKTPRFTVTFATNFSTDRIVVNMTSFRGLVENVQVEVKDNRMYSLLTELGSKLKGVKFQAQDIENAIVNHINSVSLTALDRKLCNDFLVWLLNEL